LMRKKEEKWANCYCCDETEFRKEKRASRKPRCLVRTTGPASEDVKIRKSFWKKKKERGRRILDWQKKGTRAFAKRGNTQEGSS